MSPKKKIYQFQDRMRQKVMRDLHRQRLIYISSQVHLRKIVTYSIVSKIEHSKNARMSCWCINTCVRQPKSHVNLIQSSERLEIILRHTKCFSNACDTFFVGRFNLKFNLISLYRLWSSFFLRLIGGMRSCFSILHSSLTKNLVKNAGQAVL